MDENQDSQESKGISTAQWVAIGALGVLTAVAVALAVAARRTRTPDVELPQGQEPWMVSLRHFAGATDYRFLGIEAKLRAHDDLLGVKQPPPPAPVDLTFHPTPEPPGSDGSVSMSTVPVGATEPPPPGPAAVSLPPDAD